MRRFISQRLLLAALVLTASSNAIAQSDTSAIKPLSDVLTVLKALAGGTDLKALFKSAASDPDFLNSALEATLGKTPAGRILENLNVRFATFDVTDMDTQGLGLTYTLNHSLKQQLFTTGGAGASGLDFRLNATGNVAFDRRLNPRDFLKSDGALSYFVSRGGAVATTTATRSRLDTLRIQLAEITNQDELESSPLLAEYMRLVMRNMTTQVHLDVSAAAGLESNQSFQQRQYAYSARVGLDIKPWSPSSTLAQWNVFDWPFAALRWLQGTDSVFMPRGTAFPTVSVGVGLIDPVENDRRDALGVTGRYARVALEGSMNTEFVRSPAGPLNVQLNARLFQEVGADAAIKNARLDKFSYVTIAMVSTQGPFVSYSKGRLPFDLTAAEVFELGFKLYF